MKLNQIAKPSTASAFPKMRLSFESVDPRINTMMTRVYRCMNPLAIVHRTQRAECLLQVGHFHQHAHRAVQRRVEQGEGYPRPRLLAEAGVGTWEGRVPEPAGETVVVRYSLKDLLDKLDELCAQDGP